jgi:hypothetical protein
MFAVVGVSELLYGLATLLLGKEQQYLLSRKLDGFRAHLNIFGMIKIYLLCQELNPSSSSP